MHTTRCYRHARKLTHQMPDHSQRIRQGFTLLRQARDDDLEFEVLQGGVSEAYTYLVDLGAGPKVLKLTAATSAPWVLQRAQRELLFYRELAPQVSLRVPRLLASYTDGTGTNALLFVAYRPTDGEKRTTGTSRSSWRLSTRSSGTRPRSFPPTHG